MNSRAEIINNVINLNCTNSIKLSNPRFGGSLLVFQYCLIMSSTPDFVDHGDSHRLCIINKPQMSPIYIFS